MFYLFENIVSPSHKNATKHIFGFVPNWHWRRGSYTLSKLTYKTGKYQLKENAVAECFITANVCIRKRKSFRRALCLVWLCVCVRLCLCLCLCFVLFLAFAGCLAATWVWFLSKLYGTVCSNHDTYGHTIHSRIYMLRLTMLSVRIQFYSTQQTQYDGNRKRQNNDDNDHLLHIPNNVEYNNTSSRTHLDLYISVCWKRREENCSIWTLADTKPTPAHHTHAHVHLIYILVCLGCTFGWIDVKVKI